ncbi:alkaline phosphatase family protein [Actinokineospora alba]|uniref:alkaline phosphatase family protein n=1 Tax=Actinokineospora alba TaxID=504798 RepID=UPI001E412AC1|nr:alkaline phosphatase family protein [Actinokineospora alba]
MTPTDDVSRRRFLGLGAAAGGLAAVSSLLPPSLLRAMAETPVRAGGLAAVEHVIVLTQENRSFDHYFGSPTPPIPTTTRDTTGPPTPSGCRRPGCRGRCTRSGTTSTTTRSSTSPCSSGSARKPCRR